LKKDTVLPFSERIPEQKP